MEPLEIEHTCPQCGSKFYVMGEGVITNILSSNILCQKCIYKREGASVEETSSCDENVL